MNTRPTTANAAVEVKFLEVRDEGTFIAVMAIHGDMQEIPDEIAGRYLLRRGGWADYQEFTYVLTLHGCRATYDPYKWGECRTMTTAHKWIREHWDSLSDGDVVDVEWILGERKTPKQSGRYDYPLSEGV